jgi:hypothetical protein
METTLLKNRTFTVEFYHSDGFGQISNESEFDVSEEELKNMFSGEVRDVVEGWMRGEFEGEIEFNSEEDESQSVLIKTTDWGALRISFLDEYRAGGYDDCPIYRYDEDVYYIK